MSSHKLAYKNFVDDLDLDAIEEALGFEPLEHKKGEDIGYCLFPERHSHGDTTGKFSINREKKVYHCWACGGGSLLSLVMEKNDVSEETATEWLAQYAHGDTRSDTTLVHDLLKVIEEHEVKRSEMMPYFNERVLAQFHSEGEENELFEWAESRGISDGVVVSRQLGYSDYHRKAAPIRGGEKIDDDYYGPVVVFPHFWEKRLVGWQHRWLNHGIDTPKWLPKYTNTSDFPKAHTVYNFDEAIKQDTQVVVVESVPTVLFLLSFGINAVATFGSGVMENQLRLLRRFEHVIISPDNDKPGEKFGRVAQAYLERYTKVTLLPPPGDLPEGADVGDYIDKADPVAELYVYLFEPNSRDEEEPYEYIGIT
jgi:DNA primase